MTMKSKINYYVAVFLCVIVSLIPIIWCFVLSITPESELLRNTSSILPEHFIFDHYITIFTPNTKESAIVLSGLINSLKIAIVTLMIGVPISVITGYVFARYNFNGKQLILRLLLLTMVIPVFATIIPIYNLFRELDLLDSMFWTAIIYVSAFLPLNTWMVMNYIQDLPRELWRAAAIDGFSQWQQFTRIALPLTYPIILTNTLIMFLMAWKQYLIPVILLSSYQNKTLTMIMSEFMSRNAIDYGIIAAAGIIAIIPPVIVAILFRRFLINGLTAGSVKQ